MRPKKIILCVNGNEHELSVLKFTLTTNGYKVVSATTTQEAIGAFGSMQVDLVLSEMNLMGVVLNRSTERNDSPYY